MIKAGSFAVKVYSPYPVSCVITHDGKEILRIPHTELNDLEYVIRKATHEAKAKLHDNSKHEIIL